ncbi:DUF4407 domain-containing protein [Catellatospora sp. NPDC049133]|uniref:DUF4407 domain-containing protein n=1 Tax=Catellatospora sp. NPDC049133 TaxID=3155499 RepID=UPI0033D5B0A1
MTDTYIKPTATVPTDGERYRYAVNDQPPAWTPRPLNRPALPDQSLARLPRRLVGVREEILDWVPEDRPKYTRLGMIVANAAILAAVSALVALQRVVEVSWIALIPFVLFWGFIILVVDSWMVSSTHGALGAGRKMMLVPRLLLAVVIGSVIAEPLVLWIFHPAIHANVLQDREDSVDKYAGRWNACNPVTGSTVNDAACADFQLGIVAPQETRDKLTSLIADRGTLNQEIGALAAQLRDKQSLAQAECAGIKRTGTSGQPGKGFRCDSAWTVANNFEAEIGLPTKRTTLQGLDREINTLRTGLQQAEADHSRNIEEGIASKVQKMQASYGKIDIIDESRALERLSEESPFVRFAKWTLRMLLILLDSLPVLAKLLSGTTSYDTLVNKQLLAGQRFHGRDLALAEHRHETATNARVDELDMESRTAQARHDEELEAEIDRRSKRYAAMDAGS